MEPESLLNLSDSEKLEALREVDVFRPWNSLDDKRRCLKCGVSITGRQIAFVVDGDGGGPRRGKCPTRGCAAIPLDWALPRDPEMMIPGAEEVALEAPGFLFEEAGGRGRPAEWGAA